MPIVETNGIELYYEQLGDGDLDPILLIAGLGAHCTGYDDAFCDALVALGHPVVRYDNRDVGLSTHLPGSNYLLADMAADAVGLMDALQMDAAHVVGTSMGGMIAQLLAIDHPRRLISLTSIMSSTGEPHVGQARPEVLAVLLEPAPEGEARAAAIERGMRTARAIGSPDFDEDYHMRRQVSFVDRGADPGGVARQAVAVVSSGDRAEGLRGVGVPTLVIHGTEDPLIHISGGRRTAELVPGARLIEIAGMGHDLPPRHYPEIVGEIAAHITAASAAADTTGKDDAA